MPPALHVAPEPDRAIEEAVTAAGGHLTGPDQAEALIWLDSESFPEELLNLPPRPHQRMKASEGA